MINYAINALLSFSIIGPLPLKRHSKYKNKKKIKIIKNEIKMK